MTLYDSWKRIAFDQQGNAVKHVWDEYLAKEKLVYANLIKTKTTRLEGTPVELAEQFNLTLTHMGAFFHGINECVEIPPVEEIEEDTQISFDIDFEKLYKQMVEYKAEELYNLPEWDTMFTKEEQKQYYVEQKRSHTVVRNDTKVGRNDPCTCGSGKKYKKCCGAV